MTKRILTRQDRGATVRKHRAALIIIPALLMNSGCDVPEPEPATSRQGPFEPATSAQVQHINALMDEARVVGPGLTAPASPRQESGRVWHGYLVVFPIRSGATDENDPEIGVWFHVGAGGKEIPGMTIGVNDAAIAACICQPSNPY